MFQGWINYINHGYWTHFFKIIVILFDQENIIYVGYR